MHAAFWRAITRRHAASSVASICLHIDAPCVLAWLGATAPEHRRHYWKGHYGFRTVTHTRPSATAIPAGAPPTWVVVVPYVRGSIRVTVPSPAFATQTARAPTAFADGAPPTS